MCIQCHECDPPVQFETGRFISWFFHPALTPLLFLPILYSSSWTCANYMSLFCICSFPSQTKKLQKRERTCRAYMKVLKQSFCPLCLQLLSPLFLYYRTVYALAQVQQHAPSPLSCTPSSLCFLLFWVIASHKNTVVFKVLPKSKRSHLQLLRWLLFVTVYVSSFFSLLYALTAMVYFVVSSVCPCYYFLCLLKTARLHE